LGIKSCILAVKKYKKEKTENKKAIQNYNNEWRDSIYG